MEDNTSNPTTTAAEPTPDASAEQAEAQRQRDEYYDLLLRKQAEFDNYRKRVERERQMVS